MDFKKYKILTYRKACRLNLVSGAKYKEKEEKRDYEETMKRLLLT